jgi:hypothetical protein
MYPRITPLNPEIHVNHVYNFSDRLLENTRFTITETNHIINSMDVIPSCFQSLTNNNANHRSRKQPKLCTELYH